MALTKGQKIAIGVTAGVVTIGGIVLAVKWKDWFGEKNKTSGSNKETPTQQTATQPTTKKKTTKKKTTWDKIQNALTFSKESVEIAEGISDIFRKKFAEGKLEPIAYEYIKQ